MATWNDQTQFGPSPDGAGTMKECGSFACTATEVDGESLHIPTKLARIRGGHRRSAIDGRCATRRSG